MAELSISAIEVPTASRPRPLAILCDPVAWVGAPVMLGLALQVNYGQYHPLAIRWLGFALIACVASVFGVAANSRAQGASANSLPRILAAGLALQFIVLLINSPTATMVTRSSADLIPFQIGILAAMACAGVALIGRWPRMALFGLLAAHFLVGLWILRMTPPPPVDVCVFQHDACQALLHGQNPYAMTFNNPYADPARVYAPGTFANGRLLFGYPYPPLSLFLVLPGYLLGDFRFAHLAATTLAGALIALARPGKVATLAAALFLFTPRGFFVLEAGWTEPLVVLMLAAFVFSLCRRLWVTPILFGLLLVTKQYLVLAAPFVLFISQRKQLSDAVSKIFTERVKPTCRVGALAHHLMSPERKAMGEYAHPTGWLAAVGVPLLISLPLILWNLPAFMHSAVLLQFHQPMRMDALSFAPWFLTQTGFHFPIWLPFLAVAAAIIFVYRQPSRTPSALLAGLALVFFLFFALNKQAFCNYYFFVIGVMCCALATWNCRTVSGNSPADGV